MEVFVNRSWRGRENCCGTQTGRGRGERGREKSPSNDDQSAWHAHVRVVRERLELLVDGEVAGTAFEGETRCRPFEVLCAMANDLSARGLGLAEGEYVTTGAAATPSVCF